MRQRVERVGLDAPRAKRRRVIKWPTCCAGEAAVILENAACGVGPCDDWVNVRETLLTMNSPDPVLHRQLPLIAKIVADETWLEGERRGRPVEPSDQNVREKVCEVVLRMGHEMRQQVLREMAAERQARMGQVEARASSQSVAA